jgi:hypothetical protein
MVTGFKKLGSGEHPIANVERIKKSGCKINADARCKLYGAGGKPVAVVVARKPDEMFGSNIGGKKGRPHQRPR